MRILPLAGGVRGGMDTFHNKKFSRYPPPSPLRGGKYEDPRMNRGIYETLALIRFPTTVTPLNAKL
jgi:hypothetical protein